VYKTAENKFVTASPKDTVRGLVLGAYRNGYGIPVGEAVR
jgi:hypothetical protein